MTVGGRDEVEGAVGDKVSFRWCQRILSTTLLLPLLLRREGAPIARSEEAVLRAEKKLSLRWHRPLVIFMSRASHQRMPSPRVKPTLKVACPAEEGVACVSLTCLARG